MSRGRVCRLISYGSAVSLLILTLSSRPVCAQAGATTGLQGRVVDSTGAAVPGVTVTLVHVDTGRERVVTTGPEGAWEARFLTPGTFRVTFELSGFRTHRQEGVEVSTAEMGTVNAALEVGGVAEAV